MDKATVIAAILCIIVIITVIILLVFSLRKEKKPAPVPPHGNGKSAENQKRKTAKAAAASEEKLSALWSQIPRPNLKPSSSGDTVFLYSGWHIYTQDPQQDANSGWVDEGIVSRSGWTIGRNQDCNVCIPKKCVSDQHVVIDRNRQREWYLQNLSDTTGTIYLGYRDDGETHEMALKEKIQLSPGEGAEYYFLMGEVYLGLVWESPPPPTLIDRTQDNEDTQRDAASRAGQQKRYEQGFDEFTGSGRGHSSPDDL